MAVTYSQIATQTLGSAASSVTFSGISGTYTDLVLVATPKVTASTTFAVRFNSDTGSNYSATFLYGDGTSAVSTRVTSQTEIRVTYGATARSTNTGMFTVQINNYSNSTTNKTVLSREDWAGEGTGAIVGLWRSTSAITSITIIPISGGTIIDTGSTFSLYGIKAA